MGFRMLLGREAFRGRFLVDAGNSFFGGKPKRKKKKKLKKKVAESDGVDGYIARRRGPTALGAFLDPLADKVLVLGAMFTLVTKDVFWIVPVAIIAGREFVISVYRTFVASKGVSFGSVASRSTHRPPVRSPTSQACDHMW